MKKKITGLLLILCMMIVFSSSGFSVGFGDITFQKGSFNYNGASYKQLVLTRFAGIFNGINAKDVLEMKVFQDPVYGKVMSIKIKTRTWEFPTKNIKNIMQDDETIFVDLQ
jgi:hypothetical protein